MNELILEQEGLRKDDQMLFDLPQDRPGLPNRITRAASNITTAITSTLSALASRSRSPSMDGGQCEDDPPLFTSMLPCPIDMMEFEVPHDPYLSPYWASDVVLSQLPPVHIMVTISNSLQLADYKVPCSCQSCHVKLSVLG